MSFQSGEECYQPKGQGRLYIPHGHGKEGIYRPHAEHIDVSYTYSGPDWTSSIRYIPSPKPGEGRPSYTTFHPPMKSIRHYPERANVTTTSEYNFYPPIGDSVSSGKGKVTSFDSIHKASQLCKTEISDSVQFGSHTKVFDPRNGISEASPGDKPYQVVEFSKNFHKCGSTRPVVDFGRIAVKSIVVPVMQRNNIRVKPYRVKEAERQYAMEVNSVRDLDYWRPASPLTAPVMDTRA